ncbi:hypothetical protein [Luteimonas sp. 100069]|uniref:hypothetical protein n=1 Tax=Luteimonas sp. 100069 TaxID=2006109 RepID=UPI000F505311|nr:hypothetical protein [Luteimonas sp. 100069]
MTSQPMRGFNADDARSLAGPAQRHVAEFVVADILRQAEAAARESRHCLESDIDAAQLSEEECVRIARSIEARGFDVALAREGDRAVFALRW